MQLSKQELQEFKRLYKKDYGVELTDLEATQFAPKVINLVRIANEPIKKSNNKIDNK